VEGKRTRIIDHKTRRSNKMPSPSQTRVAEFQLMTYYRLLKQVRSETLDLKNVLNFYDLNESSLITQEFLAQLEPSHRPKERNLLRLGGMAVRFAKRLPELSEDLEVIYENKETNRIIGSHRFQFSEETWKQDLEFASQYWLGNRPAKPVSERNRWKCDYCGFKERSICPVWTE
jgi:exonuclease V